MTKPLERCAVNAALDQHVTAHTMRRTFNNLARQAAMTGHTTTAMTEHDSHVTLEEKAKAVTSALGSLRTTVAASGVSGVTPVKQSLSDANPRGVEEDNPA